MDEDPEALDFFDGRLALDDELLTGLADVADDAVAPSWESSAESVAFVTFEEAVAPDDDSEAVS